MKVSYYESEACPEFGLDKKLYRSSMIPVGLDDDGMALYWDIKDIPHIFISGYTESGKTSFVLSILSMLFYVRKVFDCKFVIYDSKGVDYNLIEDSVQLLIPVIKETKMAEAIIAYLQAETERRIKALVEKGFKKISDYNDNKEIQRSGKMMQHIFAIFDDVATIPSQYINSESVANILIKGHAVGVHFIFVTSSPQSIRNDFFRKFPCSISFKESNLMSFGIKRNGGLTEDLHSPGEIICTYVDKSYKLKSTYITDKDIATAAKLDSYSIMQKISRKADALFGNASASVIPPVSDLDSYLYEAALLGIEKGKLSSGMIQRVFKIGYNRAAKIVDQLEKVGLVSGEMGTAPREILMSNEEWMKKYDELKGKKKVVPPAFRNVVPFTISNDSVLRNRDIRSCDESWLVLRDFAETTIGDNISIGVEYGRAFCRKPIMTAQGAALLKTSLSGEKISKIVYRKPRLTRNGYFLLETMGKEHNEISYDDDTMGMLQIKQEDLPASIENEFAAHYKDAILDFLQQISEDTGIEIIEE